MEDLDGIEEPEHDRLFGFPVLTLRLTHQESHSIAGVVTMMLWKKNLFWLRCRSIMSSRHIPYAREHNIL